MFVDFHCDTLYQLIEKDYDITKRSKEGHIDIERLQEGDVHLQVFAAFIDPKHMRKNAATIALKMIDKLYQLIKKNDKLMLVLNGKDIDRIEKEDKIGVMLSIEGGEALEGDIALLRMFYRLGVRALALTWSLRNDLGDGVEGVAESGLTSFGKDVVKEMNKLGMIIDVSHLNERGFWNVMEISEKPVIASHSDCKALCSHKRNLTDEQIKAIAGKGGVIGINFAPEFLKESGKASVEDVICHIDHICGLVGSEYVGFGSDFDGIDDVPEDLYDVSCFPKIIDGLKRRGYKEKDIDLICHENFERLIKKII
ncbi:MAG: dipeptidase [Thermoanaerobacteraceae bacterium]|nr:dipeptidase [Thermoanaerobacteraceae bacterium]